MDDDKFEKCSKVIGLVIFFVGIVFLIVTFALAYGFFMNAGLPEVSSMETFFNASIILSAKFVACIIMAMCGSYVSSKGIRMAKTMKVTLKQD
ncbi:MAG: hypothetical protein COS08_07325 [Euryarchaeota archaeon CG01_land_8_20_14_3_00_38_12]|nr:MAG: hypothetical protein COS08_07325 [Euryarchaeota archaeon CG01_land_8_20_14_3_00_38_12]PJB21033.1 MAG: hypothetical protein CO114_07535 [Euryarchaeota archaeon CG_4_9_14_3_um_filter_38_12]